MKFKKNVYSVRMNVMVVLNPRINVRVAVMVTFLLMTNALQTVAGPNFSIQPP
jgi:hypothetical protein